MISILVMGTLEHYPHHLHKNDTTWRIRHNPWTCRAGFHPPPLPSKAHPPHNAMVMIAIVDFSNHVGHVSMTIGCIPLKVDIQWWSMQCIGSQSQAAAVWWNPIAFLVAMWQRLLIGRVLNKKDGWMMLYSCQWCIHRWPFVVVLVLCKCCQHKGIQVVIVDQCCTWRQHHVKLLETWHTKWIFESVSGRAVGDGRRYGDIDKCLVLKHWVFFGWIIYNNHA